MILSKITIFILPVLFCLNSCAGQIYDPTKPLPVAKKKLISAIAITISESRLEILRGEQAQVVAEVKLSDGKSNNIVNWKSSNPEVAAVNRNGAIFGISPGSAEITATSRADEANKSAVLKITVLPNPNDKTEPSPAPSVQNPVINNPAVPAGSIPGTVAGSSSPPNNNNLNADGAIVKGNVFDLGWNPVAGASVTLKGLEGTFTEQNKITGDDGAYQFDNIPGGISAELTVSKEGWTSATRTVTLKAATDSKTNIFNFGGANDNDNLFGIQDQPLVSEISLNNNKLTGTGSENIITELNKAPSENAQVSISGISPANLEIKFSFSETVIKEDVENSLQIISQEFASDGNKHFIISKSLPELTFKWEDNDKKMTLLYNRELPGSDSGNEARYRIQFTAPFKDTTNKSSVSGKMIRFSPGKFADYALFSVKKPGQD